MAVINYSNILRVTEMDKKNLWLQQSGHAHHRKGPYYHGGLGGDYQVPPLCFGIEKVVVFVFSH